MDPLAIYQWLYEKTDGRFTWLGGLPVLLLRTTGAKTCCRRREPAPRPHVLRWT